MSAKSAHRVAGAAVLLIGGLMVLPATAADRPTDAEIDLWVTTALQQDPRVDAPEVAVTCRHGIVTLSGEVGSLAAREYADREATKIRGVLGVINQLEVGPGFRTDLEIHTAVARRLEGSPLIRSRDVRVAVVQGEVVLSGSVGSWAEREEAELLAREVAGVKKVTDDLVVSWASSRSDSDIRSDVESSLSRDVYLTGQPISVETEEGVVTLRGTVGNAYEKDRARDDARWVRGVKEVRNELSVDWLGDRGVDVRRQAPTDHVLRARVREVLDHDWRLDPTGISIAVDHGAVTLTGSVYNHRERELAEADTRDVVGVAWVVNRLFAQVDARDDREIQDDVRFDLDTDFATADLHLDATVHHGVVTLSGEVESWFARSRAADIASGVPGVRSVVNDITVARSSWKVDADLTAAIQKRLTWNWTTWWVHDDIGVTVTNGVATLTGNVDSWRERSEAAKVALAVPGVWKVDDRLTVNGYDYPWHEYYYHGPYEYGLNDDR